MEEEPLSKHQICTKLEPVAEAGLCGFGLL
jgi:hypothetical protein